MHYAEPYHTVHCSQQVEFLTCEKTKKDIAKKNAKAMNPSSFFERELINCNTIPLEESMELHG